MKWPVALAMGLMAWGAYVLTRNRPAATRTEAPPTIPENGRSPSTHSSWTHSTHEATSAERVAMAPAEVMAPAEDTAPRSLIRVTWSVRVPEGTPSAFIYICGNHAALGHWNPMGVALSLAAPGLYRGELRMPAGTSFEYKFTRGTWASVEVLKDGTHRANRLLDLDHSADLESEVEAWADQV